MSDHASMTLNQHLSRLLLRFFRRGEGVVLNRSEFRLQEDLEYLRIQWAMSSQVEDLAQYLVENRHEAQASLEMLLREDSGIVRGRLDPARTIRRRRLTGDVTQVAYHEPRRNFSQGPNHVLAWTLRFGHHILQRYLQLLSRSEDYNERVHRILRYLESIRHLRGIGESVSNASLRLRPSIKSVTQAGKSRKRLYRKAFAAYRLLTQIESGDADEIVALLNGSLIGPLEDWQKFELLLAIKLAAGMSEATGHALVLRPIEPGSARPIACFGPYDVYWQNRSPYQRFPELEPSEVVVNDILRRYGISVGSDRPDVVICNRETEIVVAIAEAKYSTSQSDAWKDAFREATAQLVRYSRLYTNRVPQDVLLRRSVLAVSNLPADMRLAPPPGEAPVAIGLADLLEGRLGAWVQRVTSL